MGARRRLPGPLGAERPKAGATGPTLPAMPGDKAYFVANDLGALQYWTVPLGVTSIGVKMWGGGGTGVCSNDDGGRVSVGGGGGCIVGTVAVTPGEVLQLHVGKSGTGHYEGGRGSWLWSRAPDGTLTLLMVAGGGGSGGQYGYNARGGAGGGANGQDGAGYPAASFGGKGATTSAGGAGGSGSGSDPGAAGGAGTYASDGSGGPGGGWGSQGGHGGGGYFTGGGGAGGWETMGGGGGGAGYFNAMRTSAVTAFTGSYNVPGNSGDSDRAMVGPYCAYGKCSNECSAGDPGTTISRSYSGGLVAITY